MMIIDSNIYWLPSRLFTEEDFLKRFLRAVPRVYGTNAFVKKSHNGEKKEIIIERPKGFPSLNYIENEYLLEKQLAEMEAAGVDQGILKLPGCQEWLTLELCKMFHDEMYEHVKNSDGKLKGLAVLPPIVDEECLKELERAINELGFVGFQMSAHYGEVYLDDEMFKPLFKKINEMKIPIYVHHTPVPVEFDYLYEYNNLRRSYGRCIDQGIAIGREIFSGLFEEYPNLIMIHSMLGGGFFAQKNLLFPKQSGQGRFEANNSKYENYLKNNIFFEMSHAQPWGKKQLECAVEVLGADNIIYGSSYPVNSEWFLGGSKFVADLDISDEEKRKILSENVRRIYKF